MRVIICGAGIAGLALARALGTGAVVLEKAPAPPAGGYMIDFFGPGYDAAEAMGVLPRIRELGYQVDELAYCDESGRRRAGLRFAALARAAGGRVVSIMRPDLARAFGAGVDVRHGRTITALDNRPDGVTVTLDNGETLDADLLVGSDGIHSRVRALAFGPQEQFVRHLGFHTAAYLFDDPPAHAEVAGRFCLTDSLHRTMGFYGLRDGRVAAFAVHPTTDPALPADPRAALRQEYGGLGWIAPRALAACPPRFYYDQVAQTVVPRWADGRVVLLGDAAHAVSLLAGQGASLAVAGAQVLAGSLRRCGSIEEALRGYERTLRPLVEEKQERARGAARWFVPRTPAQRWMRRTALRAAALPFADRLVTTSLVGKQAALLTE